MGNKGFKIFILIFILSIVVFFSTKYKDKIIPKDTIKTLEIVQQIPTSEGEKVRAYDDIIVKYKDDSINTLNADGTNKWEKGLNIERPLVFPGEKTIYFCQGTTGELYFLDFDGNSTKKVELGIAVDKIIEKEGTLYAICKDKNKEVLILIDNSGNILGSIPSGEKILNFESNMDKSKVVISSLRAANGNIQSNLSFYNTKGDILSNVGFNDEIVTFLKFIDKDIVIAMTDKAIYKINSQTVVWNQKIENLKDIYVDNGEKMNIYVLGGKSLKIFDDSGEIQEEMALDGDYKKIYSYNGMLILVGDKNVLGFKKGKEILNYNIEDGEKVIIDNSNIMLVTAEKTYLMKTIEKQ